jgi:hypothetical protein
MSSYPIVFTRSPLYEVGSSVAFEYGEVTKLLYTKYSKIANYDDFWRKNMKNKKLSASTIIVLLFALTLTAMTANIGTVNAAVAEIDTYAFCYPLPDPVGVGQQVLVTYRIDKVSPTAVGTSGGDHFNNFKVTITTPDGQIEIKSGLTTDATSGGWLTYNPTKVGTYTFQANFPGQWINTTAIQRWFKPSTSTVVSLTVQQDPIVTIPDNPLPTDYWTRPINAENKGWWQVADNWLMQGYDYTTRSFGSSNAAFSPFTSAPDSPHVLWTKPIMYGGVIGGPYGDKIYYEGLSYEQHYNPLILGGRIIFTEHSPTTTTILNTRCIDLYTGEEIWNLNNTNIAFAQVFEYDSPNEHGGLPYLWATSGSNLNGTFTMYDAWTARQWLTVTNVTWGGLGSFGINTLRFGPNGEILSYYLDGTNNWMTLWNSTKAIYRQGSIDTWSPALGSVFDGRVGIEWNVTVPDVPGNPSAREVTDGYLMAQYADSSTIPATYEQMAYNVGSMKKDSAGNYPTTLPQLWVQNRTGIYISFYLQTNIGSGIYAIFDQSRLQYRAYSITTGTEVWVTEPIATPWASYNWQWWIAYGFLYTAGYDGYIRAYNATTGKLAWSLLFPSAGYENAYGTFPVYSGFNIADGKLYITNDEHSPDAIPWRGGKLWCIDAFTGEGLWNISGKLRMGAISDGIYTVLNSLDGKIYTFGKGPSQTTVTAPQTEVQLGTSCVITGSVTDQSPGQLGTPAISDKDMAAWMEYKHMQKQIPANAKGVPVTISATDSNGNTKVIGTVTSEMSGKFGCKWTPTSEGLYKITATFAGTNSYASSYDETFISIGPTQASPQPTQTPVPTTSVEPTTAPTATTSPSPVPNTGSGIGTEVYIAAAAAVIVAIIAAIALIMRKRK